MAAGALDDERVQFATLNRPQHLLRFGEPRAQALDLVVRISGAGHHRLTLRRQAP
jgi:hypothetical protein